MILSKVGAKLTKQDWLGVFLDFVVVVLGVFIGIQVNNWNQARIHQKEESEYLSLLTRDLTNDLERIGYIRDIVEHHVKATNTIRDAVAGSQSTTAELERAFTFLYLTFDYTPIAPAYTSLLNGARLDLIGDATLRTDIIDYYEIHEPVFINEYLAAYKHAQARLHDHFWKYVRFSYSGDPKITSPLPDDLDFTRLLVPITKGADDIEFLNDLNEVGGRGAEILTVLEELRQKNQDLQKAIRKYQK